MKLLLYVSISALLLLSGCKKISSDIVYEEKKVVNFEDKALLSINDKTYYESDVFEFNSSIIKEVNESDYANSSIKESLVNDFIIHNILYLEAEKEGFTPTDGRVDKLINIIKTDKGSHELKIGTGIYATDNQKMSKMIQQRFVVDKLLSKLSNQELNITEDRIRDYYNKGLGSAKSSSKVRLSQIFSTDIKVVEKAQEELSKGFSFSEVAMRYSESPEGKSGGSLGYIERSADVPEFIIDALKHPIGKYTNIIQSDYGYHIFYLTGVVTPARKPPYNDIKKNLEQEIRQEEQEQIIKRYIDELWAKNQITIINAIDLNDYKLYIASRSN